MIKINNKRKTGGYSGIYEGNFLRSGYEYVFVKILEHDKTIYKFEAFSFQVDGSEYTPDFFIYDNDGILTNVIEIRGARFNLEERAVQIHKLQEQHPNICFHLITEKELKEYCVVRNLDFKKLLNYWRTASFTSRNDVLGSKNPMYGKTHSNATKAKISQTKIQNAIENPDKYYQLGKELESWCRERDYDFLKGERVPRLQIECKECGQIFEVVPHRRDQIYCSLACMGTANGRIATQKNIERKQSQNKILKNYIIDWTKNNAELVLGCKFNAISTTLYQLFNLIQENFGIEDVRTITDSFNTTSRKDFLKQLKEIAAHTIKD